MTELRVRCWNTNDAEAFIAKCALLGIADAELDSVMGDGWIEVIVRFVRRDDARIGKLQSAIAPFQNRAELRKRFVP